MSAPHTKTANLLIELGTEELPPTALLKLSQAFTKGLLNGLAEARLTFDTQDVKSFATPRRLAVFVGGLTTAQSDQSIEKLGPAVSAAYDKTGAPSKAALGFARSNGVDFEQLETVATDKGDRLCFKTIERGQTTTALLQNIVESALAQLPIAKRMRWGSSRTEFVRPAQWLVMLLDDAIVDAVVLGIAAGRESYGHRFHSSGPVTITSASIYAETLHKHSVIADFFERRELIKDQVSKLAQSLGGQAVIEDALLDEVTALVEWPVALAGDFDAQFLAIPHEALVYSMTEHQKYFHILDAYAQLLPHFITVSNIESKAPEKIIAGNERVIRPRLADAAFFFATDKKVSLQTLRERLKPVVFQQQLGTVYEKTERIASLSAAIASLLNADAGQASLAGQFCKADLSSDMVLEFDKMQGVAGGYYARHANLDETVAGAIEQHYLPKFANDKVPHGGVACAVALADRLDTLTGIFGIGQQPSGSKDPFALRRASIGMLQIILQNALTLDVRQLAELAVEQHASIADKPGTVTKVANYIFDRFGAYYQEQQLATEIFQSVRSINTFDPLDFDARVQAVAHFVQQPESESLAAANKRVSNILEKSTDKTSGAAAVHFDEGLLQEDAEKALAMAVAAKEASCGPLFAKRDYRDGLLQLTELKGPVDEFFDNVMVNADDEALRKNRLALLSRLRALFLGVADISILAPTKK